MSPLAVQREAAQADVFLAALGRLEGDAGGVVQRVLHGVEAAVVDQLLGDDGDRLRHVAQFLVAPADGRRRGPDRVLVGLDLRLDGGRLQRRPAGRRAAGRDAGRRGRRRRCGGGARPPARRQASAPSAGAGTGRSRPRARRAREAAASRGSRTGRREGEKRGRSSRSTCFPLRSGARAGDGGLVRNAKGVLLGQDQLPERGLLAGGRASRDGDLDLAGAAEQRLAGDRRARTACGRVRRGQSPAPRPPAMRAAMPRTVRRPTRRLPAHGVLRLR